MSNDRPFPGLSDEQNYNVDLNKRKRSLKSDAFNRYRRIDSAIQIAGIPQYDRQHDRQYDRQYDRNMTGTTQCHNVASC